MPLKITKKSFVIFRDLFPTAADALIIVRLLQSHKVGVEIAILLLFMIELKLSLQQLLYTYNFGRNHASKIRL